MTHLPEEFDFVALTSRFTSGWPWPESSWGLDPMFGEDGWCHACGTPQRAQMGPLVMQGSKFPKSEVWSPNWIHDAVCVSSELAQHLAERFSVQFLPVHKPRGGDTGYRQLLAEPSAND